MIHFTKGVGGANGRKLGLRYQPSRKICCSGLPLAVVSCAFMSDLYRPMVVSLDGDVT